MPLRYASSSACGPGRTSLCARSAGRMSTGHSPVSASPPCSNQLSYRPKYFKNARSANGSPPSPLEGEGMRVRGTPQPCALDTPLSPTLSPKGERERELIEGPKDNGPDYTGPLWMWIEQQKLSRGSCVNARSGLDDAACARPWPRFDGYARGSRRTACRPLPACGRYSCRCRSACAALSPRAP